MFKRSIENDLIGWANDPARKPLVLRGARQVGKTTVARRLGKAHFANLVELNLEDRDLLKHFREELGVDDFTQVLKIRLDLDITRDRTLLFIDEIQEAPWMIPL